LGRNQSLRQLLDKILKRLLEDEGLLISERTALREYILSNSCMQLGADTLIMQQGNYLGIGGNEQKDRILEIPRFLSFEFGVQDTFDILKNEERKWRLISYDGIKSLEDGLAYIESNTKKKVVAIIDGEIVGFEVKSSAYKDGFGSWNNVVAWEMDVYKVRYVLDDQELEENFNNRDSLEMWVKHIVRERAEKIEVYNLIEGYKMGFTVNVIAYNSNLQNDSGAWLIWQELNSTYEYDEEDEDDEELWGTEELDF